MKWVLCIAVFGCGRIGFDPASDGGPGDGLIDANIAFVTSTKHAAGALGGLDGADAVCAARATEAGLTGTYVAWLSTATTDAGSRLGAARGWVRPDGRPVADTVADLAANRLWHPIRIDEAGIDAGANVTSVVNAKVITATDMGVATGTDCSGFTSLAGNVFGGEALNSFQWSFGPQFPCSEPQPLYCFGIDKTIQVSPLPVAGRRMFLSIGRRAPSGGIATMDALCQAEAEAAGLGSTTFRAMLGTTSGSAISRFDTAGPTWVRPDGIPLAATAADLEHLLASPNVTLGGDYVQANPWASSGLSTIPVVETCNDWNGGGNGSISIASSTAPDAFGGVAAAGCINALPVYCFEE